MNYLVFRNSFIKVTKTGENNNKNIINQII